MSLQIGGAVFGFAVLTAIYNGVVNLHGGPNNAHARLLGYRAAFYGAIGLAVFGAVLSFYAIRSTSPDTPHHADLEGSPLAKPGQVDPDKKEIDVTS